MADQIRARSDSDFFGMVQTGPGPRNGSIQSGIILLIVAFGFKVVRVSISFIGTRLG